MRREISAPSEAGDARVGTKCAAIETQAEIGIMCGIVHRFISNGIESCLLCDIGRLRRRLIRGWRTDRKPA